MGKEAFDISRLNETESRRRFLVSREEEGLRLDLFLQKRLHWMSRTAVQRLIASGAAAGLDDRSAGQRLKSATHVAEGDWIEVSLPSDPKDLEEAKRNPPLRDLEILFEDEAVVVVNKPAGVPVHPVGMNLHRTILTGLHLFYRRPGDPDRDVVPQLVHRLDLETSGVLLAAKTNGALKNLTAQFRARSVQKEYLALVYGIVADDEGAVDEPIGPDPGSPVPYKRAVRREGGKEACTRFKVLERGPGITLVLFRPLTGRKHQLRVHAAAMGHPIVGDKIYGPDEKYYFKARHGPPDGEDLKALLLPRQALHAFRLTLRHPSSNIEVCFEAPRPESFVTLLEA